MRGDSRGRGRNRRAPAVMRLSSPLSQTAEPREGSRSGKKHSNQQRSAGKEGMRREKSLNWSCKKESVRSHTRHTQGLPVATHSLHHHCFTNRTMTAIYWSLTSQAADRMPRAPHMTFTAHDNRVSKLSLTLRDSETNLQAISYTAHGFTAWGVPGSECARRSGFKTHSLSVLLFMSQGLHKLGHWLCRFCII